MGMPFGAYGFFTKFAIKLIARRHGMLVKTSKDYDLADYAFCAPAIPCSAVAQQRHKIIPNRVALVSGESMSGVTGGSGPPDQPGEPTHAHLHHRQ